MQDTGISAPWPERHGRGRRYIEQEDHHVTRADYLDAPEIGDRAQGRRSILPVDNVKQHVLKPVEEIQSSKPPTNQEMKEAVKEWLMAVHNMHIFDEVKWAQEVEVKPRGSQWVLETFNPQKQTVGREGPTARAIAEKLSMMPTNELRHFGTRFSGASEANATSWREPQRRTKQAPFENNPTLASYGVHHVLGRDDCAPEGGRMSRNRKEPEAVQRRFIASGKDNFASCGQPESHGMGHSQDTDFTQGLERAIGHGRRYIGTKDSVQDTIYGEELRDSRR
jgi:hypothetical protein